MEKFRSKQRLLNKSKEQRLLNKSKETSRFQRIMIIK